MSKKLPKHVYLFGNDREGFVAHSFNKEERDEFLSVRKTYKCKKVKNSEELSSVLTVNTELVRMSENTDLLTMLEEEYLIDMLYSFEHNIFQGITNLIKEIKFIKFSEEESKEIDYLISFLKYARIMFSDEYRNDRDDEDHDLFEFLDMRKVVKSFIKDYLL